MTAHGPEAIRIVGNALNHAGILLPRGARIAVVSAALDVVDGNRTREEGIEDLAANYYDDERPFVIKLLDLAVEALTNHPQE